VTTYKLPRFGQEDEQQRIYLQKLINTVAAAGGGVTSVGATAPVTSTGGTTPVIGMPVATSLVDGYLSHTDWVTFNNKGSGTVTAVTGTAPLTSTGGTTPAIGCPVFVASGASHATGLVPDPGAVAGSTKFLREDATWQTVTSPTAANPTATASDTAVNGSASTFMRSDAAPAVQKASSSQFGLVKVDGTTITATGGVISAVGGSSPLTTKGDLFGHSTVDARIPVGTDGQSLFADSTQTLGAIWANTAMPLRYGYHEADDLIYWFPASGTSVNWIGGHTVVNTANGGGASAGVIVAGHIGVIPMTTGASSNGAVKAGMAFSDTSGTVTGSLALGSGTLEVIIIFQMPSALSTGTDRYQITAGIQSSAATSAGNDAVVFIYNDSINATSNLRASVGGVNQTVQNGTTTMLASNWYRVRLVFNVAGTSCTLFMRNITTNAAEVSECTYTGSFPASTVGMGVVFQLIKQVGTTSITSNLDALEYTLLLTNQR